MFETIRGLCKKKGISISDLEKKAALGAGTIYSWQKSSPRVENLQKVAKTLGVSITKLLK